ncbi:MAG: hypothetical protein EXS63_05220 [Candidatus Omnitrophica bacterium]|nr:hypothetical protein [Candidatus Omnitrophota bacterium]
MELFQTADPQSITNESKAFEWMQEVMAQTLIAMERFKKADQPGAFRYSLSGDIPQGHWGLGNTCFAVKIYKMLGSLNSLDIESAAQFILSFQDKQGAIFDPEIRRRSRLTRFLRVAKHLDLRHRSYAPTQRAETRQAYAALINLNKIPTHCFWDMPLTVKEVEKYIERLPWQEPWGAASHFSHLIFFLRYNEHFFGIFQNEASKLIEFAFEKLEALQQEDGSWYASDVSIPLSQKVNSAMKIMLAYETDGGRDFDKREALIDLCLSAVNEGHACNHFNVVCVLSSCSRKTSYRREDIRRYFLDRLEKFKGHYYPASGGFSFLPGKANTHYYAAKITHGIAEPDLHGTHLFLWGIVLIAEFFGFRNKLQLQFPIT